MCSDVSYVHIQGYWVFSFWQWTTQSIVDFCLTLLVVLARQSRVGQPLSPACEVEPHCGRTPRIVQQWIRELQTGMPNGCRNHDSWMGSSQAILEPGGKEGWTPKTQAAERQWELRNVLCCSRRLPRIAEVVACWRLAAHRRLHVICMT